MNMRPPVGNTCPDINQCLQWLKTCRDYIESAQAKISALDTEDSTHDIISDLNEALKYADIGTELEELRDANSALREWGYELAEHIGQLEKQIEF